MHKYSRIIAGLCAFVLALPIAYVTTVHTATAVNATDNVNLQVNVDTNLSLACGGALHIDPDVDFGIVTAGIPVVGTTSCNVTTNHESGYDLYIDRAEDTNASVLKHTDGVTYISDIAAWDGTGASTVAWNDPVTKGLGFRVQSVTGATKNDVLWGASTACTVADDAAAEFAGVPTAYAAPAPIMDHNTYVSGETATNICFKLDITPSQKSGIYSGDVIFTAISRP